MRLGRRCPKEVKAMLLFTSGVLVAGPFFNLILGTKLAPQEKQDRDAFMRAL